MVKKSILEYTTVAGTLIGDFDKAINELLREGWTLYGSPYAVKMPDSHEAISNKYQAMVREITIDVEGDDVDDGEVC